MDSASDIWPSTDGQTRYPLRIIQMQYKWQAAAFFTVFAENSVAKIDHQKHSKP
jgi:hypothetical protein